MPSTFASAQNFLGIDFTQIVGVDLLIHVTELDPHRIAGYSLDVRLDGEPPRLAALVDGNTVMDDVRLLVVGVPFDRQPVRRPDVLDAGASVGVELGRDDPQVDDGGRDVRVAAKRSSAHKRKSAGDAIVVVVDAARHVDPRVRAERSWAVRNREARALRDVLLIADDDTVHRRDSNPLVDVRRRGAQVRACVSKLVLQNHSEPLVPRVVFGAPSVIPCRRRGDELGVGG